MTSQLHGLVNDIASFHLCNRIPLIDVLLCRKHAFDLLDLVAKVHDPRLHVLGGFSRSRQGRFNIGQEEHDLLNPRYFVH